MLKFVCLASKDADHPPTTVKQRTVLSNAGLGDGSISFPQDGTSVYGGIMDKYPKLKSVGGFDLLLYQRGGGEDSGFHQILPPHTPEHLKELCGQAKIYIRPVQQDIALDDAAKLDTEKIQNDIPLIECFTCGDHIPMTEIHTHKESHQQVAKPIQEKQTTMEMFDSDIVVSKPSTSTTSSTNSPSAPATETCASTFNENDIQNVNVLSEICPNASTIEIRRALNSSNGNIHEAAQQLLGVEPITIDDLDDPASDADLLTPALECTTSPEKALHLFQKQTVIATPKERIFLSRLDGITEMKREIMGIYKNPQTNLHRAPRVCFEEEDGVGCGPVREFFSNVIKIIEEGISSSSSKPLMFLEGETDHRLPIHDQSLRAIGAFKAVGRMISHSVLHGGPFVYGLSPVVKQYLSTEANDKQLSLTLAIEDIPDIELRQLISELDELPLDQNVSPEQRLAIQPYLFEAGLDPDELNQKRKFLLDGLMTYNVIDKRRLELDDIIKDGAKLVDLVCFWTAGGLQVSNGQLLVKFDGGANNLPLSETCFKSIILPTKHEEYSSFKKNMDIALKYGSKGFSFH
ncbi:uncharacterized protein LOC116307286 isoform X2 [Actinia tenebrosa]|uniref:Uncharacterized protein LOC116307286 isoform X2 n=1 Tax=Actinia tenebrosa TaxID=6105 RepID=A0A6P8J5Z3_ACTTE|nr:uncharacterized protein LOC116307286 isoform X2 [Actinia tenebrosa]